MKTAEHTTTSASHSKRQTQPFFKKGDGVMPAAEQAPFFSKPRSGIQAKLSIGQPNDKYEQEADTTADKVVQRLSSKEVIHTKPALSGGFTPFVQAKCAACEQEEKVQKKDEEKEKEGATDKVSRKPIFESEAAPEAEEKGVQRKCAACEKEEKVQKKDEEKEKEGATDKVHRKPIFESEAAPDTEEKGVQRKCAECEKEEKLQKKDEPKEKEDKPVHLKSLTNGHAATAGSTVESGIHSSKGSGAVLPAGIRSQMESSIGADFSNVKIHTGSHAVQMSKDLNAQAFTHGSDIYFNTGKFDTTSKQGQHLLAHELTHTIQQGSVRTKPIQPLTHSAIQQKSQAKEPVSHVQNHATAITGSSKTHAAVPVQAQAIPLTPDIQKKDEEEDGYVVSTIKEGVWTLIRAASPEIHDILRYKGFVNWAKEKVSSFVTATVDTLSAPIKVGANIIAEVKEKFHEFATWMASAAERIKKGDCTPFAEASEFINNILEGITGPALEKLKAFLAPIKEFIDKVWSDVGKPIWDFITKVFGAIWDDIKWVADKIWGYIKKVINVYAEIWHWFAKAVGFEGDDQDSLWEQIKKKVSAMWEAIKKKLEPYKTQLMVVAGIILLLSPAGPFIIAAAALTGIMYAASKIRHYLQDKEAIIQERGFIKGVLIPAFFDAMHTASDFLKSKAKAIMDGLKKAVSALNGISKDIGETALSFINGIVDWLTEKFEAMSTWAETQLEKLILTLEDVFNRIVLFLQPVTDILTQVGEAIADYYKLPFLILNDLFFRIPKCVRDKIIAFLTKHVFKHIPILKEIKDVEAAWTKMQAKVMEIIDMVFKHGKLLAALWEIFNLLLDALKFPKELAVKVYNKAFDVFDMIIEKPKIFFINMLTTVKMGLTGFFDRKWTHLKNGFSNWIMGATAGTGFYPPKAFTFDEIFKMLGSIFSIGMEKVYKSIAKKRDQETADKVRKWINGISKAASKAWKWVKALHENNLDDIIDMIREKGSEMLDIAIDAIIDWIVTKVIEKVSAKLVTMLDPTGIMPVINSIIAFYNAVETAIEKAREILEFVDGVLDNITEIIAGSFEKAALKLEDNLEKAIPLFLEFLANQVFSSKLGKKLKEMATKAEKWIDEKIDWLVDKALAAGDWLLETGKKAVEAIKGWLGISREFTTTNGETHKIYFEGTENAPRIMVASTPVSIESLISDRRTSTTAAALTSVQNSHLTSALNKKGQLDTFITTNKTPNADGGQSTEALKTGIETRLDDIKQDLVAGDAIPASPQLPLSNVTFSMDGAKAGSVTAKPLTKLPGNTSGSRPPQIDSIPLGWEHVRKAFTRITKWDKVHLLSDQLHGPGEGWNLVPGARTLNAGLRDGPEKWAKDEIAKGKIIFYSIRVSSRYSDKTNNPDISDYFPKTISFSYGYMADPVKGTNETTVLSDSLDNDDPPAANSGPPSINVMPRQTIRTLFEGVSNVDMIFDTRNKLPGRSYRDLAHMYLRLKDAYKGSDDFEKTYWPIISSKFNFENAFKF